jgi:hypothetical protein
VLCEGVPASDYTAAAHGNQGRRGMGLTRPELTVAQMYRESLYRTIG